VVALALLTIRLTLGGGRPYPDVSTSPRLPATDLEVLAELPLPAGNVAASGGGRIFFDLHPFAEPWRFTDAFLFEWVDGRARPYPDAQTQADLKGALGLTVDALDRLWVVIPAGLEDRPTRLLAFDLSTDALVFDHEFDAGTFLQDLRVSPDGGTVYLADTGAFFLAPPALVVFDVEHRTARRVLEGHPAVEPQDWVIQTREGPYRLGWGLLTFSVGVDGLSLDPEGRWLYLASMSHDTLVRVPTASLRDPALTAEALAAAVEPVGSKPLSDGIQTDPYGRVLVTDVEHGGVAMVTPDGTLQTVIRSEDVVWADGIALGPEGSVLLTDSRIPAYIDPLLRPPSRAQLEAAGPHRILRFPLPPP